MPSVLDTNGSMMTERRINDLAYSVLLREMDSLDFRQVEQLVAIVKRRGTGPAGYPIARPRDFSKALNELRRLVARYSRDIGSGDQEIVERLEKSFDDLLNSDVSFYPRELLSLKMLQSEIWLLNRKPELVRNSIGPYADALHRLETGFEDFLNIIELDSRARLMLADVSNLPSITYARISMLLKLRVGASWKIFSRLAAALGTGRYQPGGGAWSYCLHFVARWLILFRRFRGTVARDFLARICEKLLLALGGGVLFASKFFSLRPFLWKSSVTHSPTGSKQKQIVISRAMGGIGDLLMMTPGLRALARRKGKAIKLLIPRKFFPIFENNPDVELADIDLTILDPKQFGRWYNFSICPAGAYEAKKVPHVRKGRVELFARGMGISRRLLTRSGWNIALYLSDHQIQFRNEFLQRSKFGKRPLVGIQPYSRDSYKDHRDISSIIEDLAQHYDILLFHHISAGLPTGLASTAGLSLSESLALVSAVDVFVAIDSAFVQAAAAFNVPVVGMFGPTDGYLFTRHIQRATVLDARYSFACAPCWRNEDIQCQITQSLSFSPCVSNINSEEIRSAIEYWISQRLK